MKGELHPSKKHRRPSTPCAYSLAYQLRRSTPRPNTTVKQNSKVQPDDQARGLDMQQKIQKNKNDLQAILGK